MPTFARTIELLRQEAEREARDARSSGNHYAADRLHEISNLLDESAREVRVCERGIKERELFHA